MWKQKLRQAIDAGECEPTPDKVKLDNNCAFGKWLNERIDPSVKKSPFYTEIVSLHAQFHKESANELMGITKGFAKYSGALTKKMKEWQASL